MAKTRTAHANIVRHVHVCFCFEVRVFVYWRLFLNEEGCSPH